MNESSAVSDSGVGSDHGSNDILHADKPVNNDECLGLCHDYFSSDIEST